MATPTITETLELPAGTVTAAAARAIKIRLRLVAADSGEAVGYATGDDVTVGGTRWTTPNTSGVYSFTNVRPNSGSSGDQISSPTGTVYELVVRFLDRPPVTRYVDVPDTAGPHLVQDILTFAPDAIPDSVAEAAIAAVAAAVPEQARDAVGSALVADEGIDITVSDGADTITVAAELATDSNKGVVELATTAESTTARTDDARAVTPAGLLGSLPWVSAAAYGAVGDGVTDDRSAILNACTAAAALGRGVVRLTPGKTYKVGKAIQVNNMDGVTIWGYGATVAYPSSTSVTVDGAATTQGHARSGFFVVDSDDVTIAGVKFTGGSSTTYTDHDGAGVYGRSSRNLKVVDCHSEGGTTLVKHDDDDTYARNCQVINCVIRNCRGSLTLCDDSVMTGTLIELDDTGYDYTVGSTHVFYMFAGRTNIKVANCTFRKIRGAALKFSGSASAVGRVIIANNVFDTCGQGIEFGADNTQDHTGLVVTGNIFRNCGNNSSSGWSAGAAIDIYGCRAVTITGNVIYYDAAASPTTAGKYGIYVRRYTQGSSQPVESVVINGNVFDVGGSATAATAVTNAVKATLIGEGAANGGTLVITGNTFAAGTIGISLDRCMSPVVSNNTFRGLNTQIELMGNRCSVVSGNTLVSAGSTNAQIRMASESWPTITGNVALGRHYGFGSGPGSSGKGWSIGDNAGGSTEVAFPLLGDHGLVASADGKEEVVFAYGSGWADNDAVLLNGTAYTYKASSPGANQFNTVAGLIALLDGTSGFDAADYGAPWSVTTNHIRVRRTTATASTFYVAVTSAGRTAGVALGNGTGATTYRVNSRGGQATGTRCVVWSPLAHHTATVSLQPANSAAATLMATNSYYDVARSTDDSSVVQQLEVGTTAGTEQWRWSLSS